MTPASTRRVCTALDLASRPEGVTSLVLAFHAHTGVRAAQRLLAELRSLGMVTGAREADQRGKRSPGKAPTVFRAVKR